MTLISATNLLRSVSLFHLTIAYFFLVSPSIISTQNLVLILGAAMDLVSRAESFDPSSSRSFADQCHPLNFNCADCYIFSVLRFCLLYTIITPGTPLCCPCSPRRRRSDSYNFAGRGLLVLLVLASACAPLVLFLADGIFVCIPAWRGAVHAEKARLGRLKQQCNIHMGFPRDAALVLG